jgi:uncharacterized delta-60 repeat protein
MIPQIGSWEEVVLMWLHSWQNRFASGRTHARLEAAGAGSRRQRPARRLSVERLEDRLAPAAGALDTTFGIGGKALADFVGAADRANAIALQADGKIVAVGATSFGGGLRNFAVARYNPDGSRDTTFNPDGEQVHNGIQVTDFAGDNDEAHGVAIQADGKILVAGSTVAGNQFSFALARYDSLGNLDPDFGTNGTVTTTGTGFGYALAVQPDGKFIVAGGSNGSGDWVLVRYNPDGKTLDAGFGTGGMVTTDIDGHFAEAHGVVLQPDGKIVVAGKTTDGAGGHRFALARYNTNGSPDITFDGDGKTTADFGGIDDESSSVALQADGKIVVAGSTSDSDSTSAVAVARFNLDGSLDSTFGGGDGKVVNDFGSTFATAGGVVIQAAGARIVVAGSVIVPDGHTFAREVALARYTPDGSLDSSFATGGTVISDFHGRTEADSMAVQADGKIVVAGTIATPSGGDFVVVRYEGVAPEIAIDLGVTGLASGSTVTYGTTPVGTPVSKTFILRNLGNLGLAVSSITVPAGFQLTSPISFPLRLTAGGRTALNVQLTAGAAGVFSGKLSVASNDDNENPFVIGVSGTALAPTREIQVLTGVTDIPDHTGAVNFGAADLGGTATRTFTVRNIGNTPLTLGPTINLPFGFFLVSGFGSTTLAPAASTTFTLGLNTGNLGTFGGQVSFANNDSDENPFDFSVTGAVTVTIAAPMIRGDSLTRQVDEGGVATLRGHLVDPDPQDDLFLRIDWGDGSEPETHAVGHAPFAFEHRYLDDAPSGTAADDDQVHVTWFDSGGGSNSKTLPVTVRNVAPQVAVGLPVHLQAGDPLSRVGSFTDPGLDSWYATVDYGDGRGAQWLPLATDNSFTLNNRYARPGVYKVQVRVFDDDGGVGTETLSVNVRGRPPQLFLGGAEVVHAGNVMRHTGSFTDSDSAARRATVDYGDGLGPQLLVILPGQQLSFEHRYATPGKYRVTVSLLEDEGVLATDSFVVTVL